MMQNLLGGRAGITLAVRVDRDGSVVESNGSGDGDSLGATTAMCDVAIAEAGEVLGLGEIEGWVGLTDGIAVYCSQVEDGLVSCMGASSRTALGNLQKVLNAVQGSGR